MVTLFHHYMVSVRVKVRNNIRVNVRISDVQQVKLVAKLAISKVRMCGPVEVMCQNADVSADAHPHLPRSFRPADV